MTVDETLDSLKGVAKELAGGLTGHDDLKEEGREQQARAKADERSGETDDQGDVANP
ncbi:MAG: hypothetical protein QOI60_902 [Actinomycetota bacterium]|jgi:uncharacterized protein YjbJ (UPF0337 family)|nr:hypothetical protein [Actinomycetota bacterium]